MREKKPNRRRLATNSISGPSPRALGQSSEPPEFANEAELQGYVNFLAEVNRARKKAMRTPGLDYAEAQRLLNGGASDALEKHVARAVRSKYGIFFSSQGLAMAVAKCINHRLASGVTIADPACGAGDLLLACLALSPLHGSLSSTLDGWGKVVLGVDLHEELASVARERVAFLATIRSAQRGFALDSCNRELNAYFPQIRASNYLNDPAFTASADCVVMNPPFIDVDAPSDCRWGNGKVQQAARFTESVLVAAKGGQDVVAVLPDVLRSGTRYGKWRAMIASVADIRSVQLFGRFDSKTDVDVFIIHMRKRAKCVVSMSNWGREKRELVPEPSTAPLGDTFHVSVGAVVPHRHKNKGSWHPYLDVAGAPRHAEIAVTRKRRFMGKLHSGPFVVLRRTSSPSDKLRAVPTIVTNDDKIAVENHLIVLQPKDGALESCRSLVDALRQASTNDWLNSEIRCRHLTVGVIRDLPIGGPR